MYKILIPIFTICVLAIFVQSCSSTKFVPDGEYLLASANVKSDKKVISTMEMESYIKQKPNYKTFAIFKLPLFIYNLAGKDTTKWVNRTLQSAGDAPVLYDSTMLYQTANNLKHIMTNKGYLNAEITPIVDFNKKRAKVTYDIKTGDPYKIYDYQIEVKDSIISNPIFVDQRNRKGNVKEKTVVLPPLSIDSILYRNSLVKENSVFNLDVLDQERERISSIFRRAGYYAFNKEYIGFEADTTLGNNHVDLDLIIYPYNQGVDANGQQTIIPHRQYKVKSVEL